MELLRLRQTLYLPRGESQGFKELRSRGLLDLTVEALVQRPEFAALFPPEVGAAARRKLSAAGAVIVGQTPEAKGELKVASVYMDFEIIGPVRDVEIIAVGNAIRELPRLRRLYGPGRWRKMKGSATIRTFDGHVRDAEVH